MKTLKKTPLHQRHVDVGARMVDFAGYDMPVQYKGVIEEHEKVRNEVGMFDLSHMGEFLVKGKESEAFLQHLLANDVTKVHDGQAQYSCMCDEKGGIIDDLLIYRYNPEHYLMVVNASNIDKDWAWVQDQVGTFEVEVKNLSDDYALIAVQGPQSEEILKPLVKGVEEISYYHFADCEVMGVKDVMVSRTGYTGEDGFELYLSDDLALKLWDKLTEMGVEPIGLGARDTLRLESGYSLYGHELTQEWTPLDASLGWTVKLDTDFVGKEALTQYKEAGVQKGVISFTMEGKNIPRQGYPVFFEDKEVGVVTSGTFSPSLKKGVGLALVEKHARQFGVELEIKVRSRRLPAVTQRFPLIKGSVKRG